MKVENLPGDSPIYEFRRVTDDHYLVLNSFGKRVYRVKTHEEALDLALSCAVFVSTELRLDDTHTFIVDEAVDGMEIFISRKATVQ